MVGHREGWHSSMASTSNPIVPSTHKAFFPLSVEMMDIMDISEYLERVAYVEAFKRQVKVDDVAATLAHKARAIRSWTTKRLPHDNTFFVSYPSNDIIQRLIVLGHLRGDGFTLLVNHWDKIRSCNPNKLKFKVSADLIKLSLICWSTDAIESIIAGYGVRFRASRSSLN